MGTRDFRHFIANIIQAALNFKESYEISELANGRPVKYYHVTEKGAV